MIRVEKGKTYLSDYEVVDFDLVTSEFSGSKVYYNVFRNHTGFYIEPGEKNLPKNVYLDGYKYKVQNKSKGIQKVEGYVEGLNDNANSYLYKKILGEEE